MRKQFQIAAVMLLALLIAPLAGAVPPPDGPPSVEVIQLSPPSLALGAEFESDESVSVPWGEWLYAVLGVFGAAVAGFLALKLNGLLESWVGKSLADRLRDYTGDAINYGINATRNAVRDKQLTIEVGNHVLERALEYGVRLFPQLIAKFGGTEAQRQRIMARLNLEAAAAIPVPQPPADAFASDYPAT